MKRADGISKGYHPNGQLKLTKTWKNGVENGKWVKYYETGQKEIEAFEKKGVADGPYTIWFDGGQVGRVGNSISGSGAEGLETWYHKNGQKWKDATFENGKIVGEWTYWDQNGNVVSVDFDDINDINEWKKKIEEN